MGSTPRGIFSLAYATRWSAATSSVMAALVHEIQVLVDPPSAPVSPSTRSLAPGLRPWSIGQTCGDLTAGVHVLGTPLRRPRLGTSTPLLAANGGCTF
ncbi:hypothetical protein NDU88_003326 [Pleurodeles waltl]|uniref:Secreted protein n=1 Tax=Pleurodeles waltl TaxID=8319 RepID=A0AAV7UC60_PLEWA|nr:hypothetical protein NDU88_003326 [Pleurodeles waltl]